MFPIVWKRCLGAFRTEVTHCPFLILHLCCVSAGHYIMSLLYIAWPNLGLQEISWKRYLIKNRIPDFDTFYFLFAWWRWWNIENFCSQEFLASSRVYRPNPINCSNLLPTFLPTVQEPNYSGTVLANFFYNEPGSKYPNFYKSCKHSIPYSCEMFFFCFVLKCRNNS